MSATITQSPDTQPAREKLPPVEMDMAAAAPARAHTAAIAMQSPAAEPEQDKQPELSQEQGNWFHRNRWFTKEPVSYTGYQFFRSAMATIPYGFGMAGVHHGFGVLNKKGAAMGLTEEGQQKYWEAFKKVDPVTKLSGGAPAGLKAIDFFKKDGAKVGGELSNFEKFLKPGVTGTIGRNMMRFSSSPINQAMQIGLSFSMFRFVGGLIKGQRDKVMDEKNTAEDTNRESKNWLQNIGDMAKVNWKAEAIGTFWAALTLGFIGANVQQTTPYKRLAGESTWNAVKRVLARPSKLLQNGAIWAIAYSTFFEVDERIQKDVKLRHGDWKGNVNSLTNKPDGDVGLPPLKDGSGTPASEQPEKPKHSFFTHDPGLPRLVFRRVLPVAVGITGYAVMKRATYVLGSGQMQAITNDIKTAAQHSNRFFGNAFREGLATGTFGILWMATDAWGSWYDKFFHDPKAAPKPPTEHQEKKYEELLARVNAKAQAQGRAA